MKNTSIRIEGSQESIYFSHYEGRLCQWIDVFLNNPFQKKFPGQISITSQGKMICTQVEIQPGRSSYRAFAPLLWPDYPQGALAMLELDAQGAKQTEEIYIGSHRPWVVYLLSDVCSDYLWAYDSVVASCADDAALTMAEIEAAEKAIQAPGAQGNHYNLVHAREVEYFNQYYPDQVERFIDHIRRGTITLNPVYNMSLFAQMTIEEILRSFYPARRLSRRYGLEDGYANIQETPTAPWGIPTLMAGCGIKYLVRSLLPYETPWARRLEEPPLYQWQGPDGSSLTVRLRQQDYTEGNFVLQGVTETNFHLHERILPAYEKLGEAYPYTCVALVGCYGDLAQNSRTFPALKTTNIDAYNRQGWEYPRLVNATHKQFWDDISPQFEKRPLTIRRGDYGTSWEAWPACLAYDFAGWRRAQERAITTDRLAAILSVLDPVWFAGHQREIEFAWKELVSLADHAWNGAFESNREANTRLRRGWQVEANRAFDRLIGSALEQLGKKVPTSQQKSLLVFNSLGWERAGLVWWQSENGEEVQVRDVHTSQLLPVQAGVMNGRCGVWIMVPPVPSVGYRCLEVQELPGENFRKAGEFTFNDLSLEGPFYRLEVDPQTGGLQRVYDKVRQVELVDPASPYSLNQAVYWCSAELDRLGGYQVYQAIDTSQMKASVPKLIKVEIGESGPLFCDLIVHTELAEMRISTTYRLYASLDRLDIHNKVAKPVTANKQELDFVFPFAISDRQYRYETPAAIIDPSIDLLPGSGQAVSSIRRFVDIFNASHGVTLALGECGLVEFGHRTSGEDPREPDPSNGTVLAVALENCFDWNESIHDQGGITAFSFRFSLRGHQAGFDAVEAIHFAWEMDNELRLTGLKTGQTGDLPADLHSFVSVEPSHLILTGFKPAEAGGLLVRVWEVSGKEASGVLGLGRLGRVASAWHTDLLESDLDPLPVGEEKVPVNVKSRGLAAVRLDVETGGGKCEKSN